MSNNVDTRVVEMRFDNKQFESGVNTTMKTLEKFKESLNFDGLARGFETISDACEAITKKFSVFGTITDQVLRNVGNRITSLGRQLISTVNQVGEGMAKYESLMNATRTMMNATGKSIEEIESALGDLNKYTDDTSYNFSDLVSSMSSMMSSGAVKDLAVAEKTMEGIANASAHAGIGIRQAAGPISVITKAMSEGKMSRIRWESLQMQNFITPQFIEQAIEAGKALGKLDKNGKILSGKGKGKIVNNQTIMDTLQYGWMDAQVMTQVFSNYVEGAGDLGDAAFQAAKEARTFTDVLDSLKDAISTGWMKSFELLFGNVEQAAKFFTWMADEVIEVADKISSARNKLLEEWNGKGGRTTLIDTIVYAWETLKQIGGQIAQAFTNIFGELSADDLFAFTEKVHNIIRDFYMWLGGDANKGLGVIAPRFVLIRQAFEGVASVGKVLLEVIKGVGSVIGSFVGDLFDIDDILLKLAETGRKVKAWAFDLVNNGKISGFFSKIRTDLAPLASSLQNLGKSILVFFKNVKKAFKESDIWKSFSTWFKGFKQDISEGFPDVIQKIANFINGISDFLASDDIPGKISSFANDFWESIKKLFGFGKKEEVDEAEQEAEEVISGIGGIARTIMNFVNTIMKMFFSTGNNGNAPVATVNEQPQQQVNIMAGFFSSLEKLFPIIASLAIPAGMAITAIAVIYKAFNFVNDLIKSIIKPLTEALEGTNKIVKKISNFIDNFGKVFNKFSKEIINGKKLENIKTVATIIIFLAGTIFMLGNLGWKKGVVGLIGVAAIIGLMAVINGMLSKFKETPEHATKGIVRLSLGIIMLTFAIKNLSGLSVEGALIGLVGLTAIMLEIIGFLYLVKKLNLRDAPKSMIGLSISIFIMASIFKMLTNLSFSQVVNALVALGGIMLELSGFMSLVRGFGKDDVPKHMIRLSISIFIMASIFKMLTNLSFSQVVNALVALGGIMLELIGFMTYVKDIGKDNVPKSMLRLSISILIMASTFKMLTNLSLDQVANALFALGGIMLELIGFMTYVKDIGKDNVPKSMLRLSISILIMASTFKMLTNLSLDQVANALFALGGIMLELIGFMTYVKDIGKDNVPKSMLRLSISILIMASAFKMLANFSFNQVTNALFALGGIMLELIGFMKYVKALGKGDAITGLIKIAVSVWSLVLIVKNLADMSLVDLAKGVVGLGLILLELNVFIRSFSKIKRLNDRSLKSLNSIGIIAAGVGAVVASLGGIGKLSFGEVIKGLIGLAGVLTVMYFFIKHIKDVFKDGSSGNYRGIIKLSFGIVILSLAMRILVTSIAPIGQLQTEQLLKGIGGITVLMYVISNLLERMSDIQKSSIKVGISVVIMMAGMSILMLSFMLAMTQLSNVPYENIAAFLIGMRSVVSAMSSILEKVKDVKIDKDFIIGLVGAFGIVAGLAVIMATIVYFIKDVSWKLIAAFMFGLSSLIESFSKLVDVASSAELSWSAIGGIAALMGAVSVLAIATAFATGLIPKDIPWELVLAFFAGLSMMILAVSSVVSSSKGSFSSLGGTALMMLGIAVLVIAAAFAIGLIPKDVPWELVGVFFAGLTAMLLMIAVVVAASALARFTALGGVVLIMLGVAVLAIAVAFAISLIPKDIPWTTVLAFFGGLTLMLLALAVVIVASTLGRFTALAGVAVVMLGVSVLAIAAAYALSKIPTNLPWESIIAFFGGLSILLVAIAVASLIAAIIPFTAMLKIAGIVLILGVVVAALVVLGSLVGGAFESMMNDFSTGMNICGNTLKDFQENTKDVSKEHIDLIKGIVEDIEGMFDTLLGRDYSGVNDFSVNLNRLGVALRSFNNRLSEIERSTIKEKLKIVDDIRTAAIKINTIPNIGDMSATIANIGGAIKLYYESLSGVDMEPKDKNGNPIDITNFDSNGFIEMFHSIADQMPDEEDLNKVAAFADKNDGTSLSMFAIGITNLSTALVTFSNEMAEAKQKPILDGIKNLKQFSAIQNALPTTAEFDSFYTFFNGKKQTLGDFALDIETVGAALSTFATDIGGALTVVDEGSGLTNMDVAITAAERMKELGNALPKRDNPLFAWFAGKQMSLAEFGTNLSTLGDGLNKFVVKAFADGVTYDKGKFDGISDLVSTFVDIQNKIVKKEHGNALNDFATYLSNAGTGIQNFNKNAMYDSNGNEVQYNIEKLEGLAKIVDIFVQVQNKIVKKDTGNAINDFAKWLNESSGNFKTFFENASKWTIDKDKLWAIAETANAFAEAFGNNFGDETAETLGEYSSTTIIDAMTNIVDRVAELFADQGYAYNKMAEAGHYIDLGLTKGINEYSYHPINAIGHVTDGIITRARTVALIASPSRVMAEIGMWIDKGLGKGIEDHADNPAKSAEEMSHGVEEAVRDALGVHSISELFKNIGKFIPDSISEGFDGTWQSLWNNITNKCTELTDAVGDIFNGGDWTSFASLLTGVDSGTLNDIKSSFETGGVEAAFNTLLSSIITGKDDDAMDSLLSIQDLFGGQSAGDGYIEGTTMADLIAMSDWDPEHLVDGDVNIGKVGTLGDTSTNTNLGSGSSSRRSSSESSNLGKQTTTVSSGGLNISMTEGYTIGDILNRIDRLETAITNMQIVLDTGILAGQVASGVDKELGTYATMNGRWN